MRRDLLFSLREIRKQPSLAITAILSLTLGIGATTAVFSVLYALLVNPYPYTGADRMVEATLVNERGGIRGFGLTGTQLQTLRQAHCIESLAATWGTWNLTTTDEELPEDVPSVQLSGNAGTHFGVPALLGRTIMPSDAPDGQDPQPVVLLSYKFWQRHFRSDPTVAGRNLQLVHKNYTIIGVMGPRFTIGDADVYVPLKLTGDPNMIVQPRIRLRPGVTHEAANAELQPLIEQFAKEMPTRSAPLSALNRIRAAVKTVDPEQQVYGQTRNLEQWIETQDEYAYGRLVAALFTGFAILALALAAIGLFSVVSYSVVQRTNEFGIRMALGASPVSVLRLVFVSTAREVAAGIVCGALFSLALNRVLVKWAEVSAQSPLVFAAATVLLAITAATAAFLPARRASTVDPMVALRYE